MRKINLVLCLLLLSGCVKHDDFIISIPFDDTPPKMINNTRCENIVAIKIFQVLDNYSLAHVCEEVSYSDDLSCYGHTVYISKNKNELHFDDKIIKPQEGKCFSYNGVYKYEAMNGMSHTVPKIKFIDSKIKNPAYTEYQKNHNIAKEE